MRDTSVTIGSFIPEKDTFIEGDDRRGYAKRVLWYHVKGLLRSIASDDGIGPDAVLLVHRVSSPQWRDCPKQALTEILALTDEYERFASEQRAKGVPEHVLAPRGEWYYLGRAQEIFLKYHEALVQMKLESALQFSDAVSDEQPATAGA